MKKVLILADNVTAEVNDSYGARLIEQGKAVVIPAREGKKPAEGTPAAKPGAKRKK